MRTGVALAAILLTVPLALATTDDDRPRYGDDYEGGNYGRIRDAADGVTIVRSEQHELAPSPEIAGVNSPIFPGDVLSSGSEQRVEVQLARGSMIWLDRDSEMTFLALPDPYAEFADNSVLQLADGGLRLAAVIDEDEEFRIDTPAATIYPLGDADLRIEVERNGRTRVTSRSGVAEVVGNGGSVILRGGMGTEVSPGTMPTDPRAINTFDRDAFDRWVANRRAEYQNLEGYAEEGGEAYDELPEEVRPYHRELSVHGSWVSTP